VREMIGSTADDRLAETAPIPCARRSDRSWRPSKNIGRWFQLIESSGPGLWQRLNGSASGSNTKSMRCAGRKAERGDRKGNKKEAIAMTQQATVGKPIQLFKSFRDDIALMQINCD